MRIAISESNIADKFKLKFKKLFIPKVPTRKCNLFVVYLHLYSVIFTCRVAFPCPCQRFRGVTPWHWFAVDNGRTLKKRLRQAHYI